VHWVRRFILFHGKRHPRELDGLPRLIAGLLYGSGLRLLEACRLRIKDLDLERRELTVRDGKRPQGPPHDDPRWPRAATGRAV
jgi:integrase